MIPEAHIGSPYKLVLPTLLKINAVLAAACCNCVHRFAAWAAPAWWMVSHGRCHGGAGAVPPSLLLLLLSLE